MRECTKRAIKKYRQNNQKAITITFCRPDIHLYEYLKTKGNVSGYVKSLIRSDYDNLHKWEDKR